MPPRHRQYTTDEGRTIPRSRRYYDWNLPGYTYDGVNKARCQHYPLCAEGQKERQEQLIKVRTFLVEELQRREQDGGGRGGSQGPTDGGSSDARGGSGTPPSQGCPNGGSEGS